MSVGISSTMLRNICATHVHHLVCYRIDSSCVQNPLSAALTTSALLIIGTLTRTAQHRELSSISASRAPAPLSLLSQTAQKQVYDALGFYSSLLKPRSSHRGTKRHARLLQLGSSGGILGSIALLNFSVLSKPAELPLNLCRESGVRLTCRFVNPHVRLELLQQRKGRLGTHDGMQLASTVTLSIVLVVKAHGCTYGLGASGAPNTRRTIACHRQM